jgi:hypothetical protein
MTNEYENIRVVRVEENPKDLCIDALLSTGDLVKITLEMQEGRPMASHWVSFKEKTGTALTYTLVTPFERAEHILGLRKSQAALQPKEGEG